MRRINKLLLLLAVLSIESECRLVPQFSTFTKESTYLDKRIILSSSPDVVTDTGSFIYAVCDSQEKTFKENRCNVSVETPAFSNATYRDTCPVHLVPEDSKRESLTKLSLYPFTDDKLLLTWTVKDLDWHTKSLQVRILHMTSCKFSDVLVQSDKLFGIVPYENTFDVVVQAFNKAFCGSDYCKVTYNAEGKRVNGPSQFLPGAKLSRVASIVAATPRTPMKGFYALAFTGNENENLRVYQAATDGKGGELTKTGSSSNVKVSNGHELFSVCWTSESTNVTCRQYGDKMAVKFNAVFEFKDDAHTASKRWIRPHNLQGGGLLMLTGTSSGKDSRRFEAFSVFKVNADGLRERPLEVGGLDFECLSASELYVNVAEEDNDEFCFHFVCERSDFDRKGIRNTLKFATKCFPRRNIAIVKHRAALLN